MIVLEALCFERRSADLRVVGEGVVRDEVERLVEHAVHLGLGVLRVRSQDGAIATRTLPDPGATHAAEVPPGLLQHRCRLAAAGRPLYTASFRHAMDGLRLLSPYTGLLLATFGPFPKSLMHLRVAIYELCVNTVEHGTPRRTPARLTLELRFEERAIAGTLHDECMPFDPRAAPVASFEDRLGARSARGYGIAMVHRLVDSLAHTAAAGGNRLDFRKRIDA
jgi:anti-sigma regulatory factor (Ser/Thr protein kinase)